ncbi:MAG: inosine/xanthosine triphosphatase [Promethearchaeota archaeon]
MNENYICVGSLNPTKIKAVELAFIKYFKNIRIFKVEVDSKVGDQPIGMEKILQGAKNRALIALSFLKKKGYKSNIYGVGIEAGLVRVPYTISNYMDFQFCAIIDEKKTLTLGSGIGFEYPKSIIEQILSDRNKEIGVLIGKLADNDNIKNEKGAIGFLSKDIIFRTEILTQATICALLPRINKILYQIE